MRIRLGYVSICTTINNEIAFKNINYTNYSKSKDINKLNYIINHNLDTLLEILRFNIKNNIHFYRITSNLIPLATHNDVYYDYIKLHKYKFDVIKKYIKNNNIRCDMHISEYAVINSTRGDVILSTISILKYHKNILELLGIKYPSIITHIGSNVFGKDKSITRFINAFNKLDKDIKSILMIENDDKIFNIIDILKICHEINIPMVLDYHHYKCNNNGEKIEDYIIEICNTWNKYNVNPKFHFSSPKSNLKKEYRTHHEYINSDEFIDFINKIKFINRDIDIMIEAKNKDEALFKLVRELKYKTNYKFIDDTTFIVDIDN